MEDDRWSQKDCYTCIGLGKVAVGMTIIARGMIITNVSPWAPHVITFGGAMVFFGILHLSLAWNMDPPPPPKRLAPRVGIPRAENERGDPDLAGEGLILHQNFPPIAGGIRDVGDVNLHDKGEAGPAHFAAKPCSVCGASRAGSGGVLRRRKPVQQGIAYEDQEIGDNNEFGPDNAVAEVGQAKASEVVGRADDVEESNQTDNEGGLGQDTDESESANESGLKKNMGEGGAYK